MQVFWPQWRIAQQCWSCHCSVGHPGTVTCSSEPHSLLLSFFSCWGFVVSFPFTMSLNCLLSCFTIFDICEQRWKTTNKKNYGSCKIQRLLPYLFTYDWRLIIDWMWCLKAFFQRGFLEKYVIFIEWRTRVKVLIYVAKQNYGCFNIFCIQRPLMRFYSMSWKKRTIRQSFQFFIKSRLCQEFGEQFPSHKKSCCNLILFSWKMQMDFFSNIHYPKNFIKNLII